MKLATGENLHKNLYNLSDEMVQHEYDLCHEVLYGHTVEDLYIPGLLETENDHGNNLETYHHAVKVWQRRLDIAKNELMERMILS